MSTPQAPAKAPTVEKVVRAGLILWSLIALVAFLIGYRPPFAWSVWGVVEVALCVALLVLGVRKWRNP